MIRERGGIDNAATWTDFTYYWELLSSEHLEFALKTLAETSRQRAAARRRVRRRSARSCSPRCEGDENDPDWLLYQGADGDRVHGASLPVAGDRLAVGRREHRPRRSLPSYYHTYYHPNNATLVLVGDFDSDEGPGAGEEVLRRRCPRAKLPRPPIHDRAAAARARGRSTFAGEGTAERVDDGLSHARASPTPTPIR